MLTKVLDRLRGLALSVLLIAAFALPALAGPFEDAVSKFANDDFSDTDEAVGAVAISGNPLAFPIISALQDGRLSADPDSKKVFVTEPDGKIIDAASFVLSAAETRNLDEPGVWPSFCAPEIAFAFPSRETTCKSPRLP